jgi:hypothetical protein
MFLPFQTSSEGLELSIDNHIRTVLSIDSSSREIKDEVAAIIGAFTPQRDQYVQSLIINDASSKKILQALKEYAESVTE